MSAKAGEKLLTENKQGLRCILRLFGQVVTTLTFDQFQHAADDASDYIAEEQPYTYFYNFLVEESSVLSIDPTGFTPLKYILSRPAQIFGWHPDASLTSLNIETRDRDSYPEILQSLLKKAQAREITRLLLQCQEGTIIQCDFRGDAYDLYFDARTSQSGYVYRYLPEEKREGDCFMTSCYTFCDSIKSKKVLSGSMSRRSWPQLICDSPIGYL